MNHDIESIFARVIAIVLFLVGIGQLAMSHIHIEAITKIFANQIGIFLFIFIIFGLTTGFNAILVEKPRSLFLLLLSSMLATWGGIVYIRLLQADVAQQEKLLMADVSQSFWMVVSAVFVYFVGSITMSILSWPDVKAAATNA